MSPKLVRVLAMAVFFAIGIPGMIVSSINDNSGAVITFGLIAVMAAVGLLAVNAVALPYVRGGRVATAAGGSSARAGSEPVGADAIETEARALEDHVQQLVASGADEEQVRDLVRQAVRMARHSSA